MHDYLIKPSIPILLGEVGNYVPKNMLSKQVGLTTQAINSLNGKITNSQNIEHLEFRRRTMKILKNLQVKVR